MNEGTTHDKEIEIGKESERERITRGSSRDAAKADSWSEIGNGADRKTIGSNQVGRSQWANRKGEISEENNRLIFGQQKSYFNGT